jgi:2-oxoglutarate dehydrogenase E1 component
VPILHLNGEDPEAAIRAARLAADYREAFRSDVVLDLIGFRRHGHSEIDDPTITQPQLYREIEKRPPLWRRYEEQLGDIPVDLDALAKEIGEELDDAKRAAEGLENTPPLRNLPEYWSAFSGGSYASRIEVDTGVTAEDLARLAAGLSRVPNDFELHPKVAKLLRQRAAMGRGEQPIDFGTAEALAFASLLESGMAVRLSGQDSRRGTFSQRHSVLFDTSNGSEHCPLAHMAFEPARFDVYDSVLSEAAVLGFEFGYSRDYPEALVLWEAQFGDFVNGAQVILDQFVTAAEDKWGLLSGLVLLLPHGHEGQGPEHSSARMERFLQLAAEDAIQVAQPSTAAQYFHLLRRQALRSWRKPLIVLTPKSMLRSPAAASPLEAFTEPRFHLVLPESTAIKDVRRLILCSGKIGHELRDRRQSTGERSIAIVSIEQLYPFPVEELNAAIEDFRNVRDIVWVQEEPANMGALTYVVPRIELLLGWRPIRTVKRSASASPATGSARAHSIEQKTLLSLALG